MSSKRAIVPAHERARSGFTSHALVVVCCSVACGAAALAQPPPPPPAAAPACACPLPDASTAGRGVVWRGSDPRITVDEIAHRLAPVLWFSPEEPLIVTGKLPEPRAHPCDMPTDDPVVYYQVTRVHLRGDQRLTPPIEEDPALFAVADQLVIRFYFYYAWDVGFSSHRHDLEVAEFVVRLDDKDGCGEVRLEEVIGFAHGIDWYYNRLVIEPDTRLPITILVEEGKHASCPDRNSDGAFTPGYDVNRFINDAWGIRDVLGSGYLGASAYQAWMTKVRSEPGRLFPPEVPDRCVSGEPSSLRNPERKLGTYQLRRASGISMEHCGQPAPEPAELVSSMNGHHFGVEWPAEQYQSELTDRLAKPAAATRWLIPSMALRYDQGLGFSMTLRGLELPLVYIVPKFNIQGRGRLAIEALVTNSAAQFYSPYLAVGVARELDGDGHQWRFVGEGGLRFRYRLHGWQRIIGLGYSFAGFRFGIRASGFETVGNLRFIVELGAGTW